MFRFRACSSLIRRWARPEARFSRFAADEFAKATLHFATLD
jgi:hypothetical protein